MSQNSEFELTEGQSLAASLGYTALAVRIDNPTGAWIKFGGQYRIPPLTFGAVLSLIPGTNNPRLVSTLTNPDGTASTSNGQTTSVTFYDTALPPAAPVPWTIQISSVISLPSIPQGNANAGGAQSWPVDVQRVKGATLAAANPVNAEIDIGGSAISTSNPVPTAVQSPNTALTTGVVVVSSAVATKIPAAPLANRKSLMITNLDGAITIRIGTSAVIATTGIPLGPGQSLPLTIGPGVDVYGFAVSGAPNAGYVELS